MTVTRIHPARAKFGGLALTSLILGIVGVCGSPVVFVNNATAIAAGVGVVLGAIALFGSKKAMAGIGVVLSVLAIVFTVVAQNAAVRELEEIFTGSADQGTPGTAQTSTWGKRHTWKDGLAVEVSAPAACTPGQSSAPSNIERAVKFTITVTNGTDKPFDAALLTVGGDAQFNGRKAEAVFDHSGGCGGNGGFESATVLPGKTYTYETSYAVGAQPGEMQLALRPSFTADKAVFIGQA
ncbi:hypothetical protein [Allokutzneria oryzae]|uniref:DUF4352 domain-containing protein n=1 Tax=Allokutzneria oryzae TaxID=1378989 RepID=A0ABV6AAT8_9PSEU